MQARCWSRKEQHFINIDRPAMVVKYNSNMGGVNLCDMLMSMYRINQHSTKYYMHMVFYCIGVTVVNGWLLYCQHLTQKNVARQNHRLKSPLVFVRLGNHQLQLQGHVVDHVQHLLFLLLHHQGKGKQHQQQTQPDVQFDQCGHFQVFQEKQQRCHHCKTAYSHLKCCKCEVHPCLVKSRNCFNTFHGVDLSTASYCWSDVVRRH